MTRPFSRRRWLHDLCCTPFNYRWVNEFSCLDEHKLAGALNPSMDAPEWIPAGSVSGRGVDAFQTEVAR